MVRLLIGPDWMMVKELVVGAKAELQTKRQKTHQIGSQAGR